MRPEKWQLLFVKIYDLVAPKIVDPFMMIIGVLFIPFVYVQMNYAFIYFVNGVSAVGLVLVLLRIRIKHKQGL